MDKKDVVPRRRIGQLPEEVFILIRELLSRPLSGNPRIPCERFRIFGIDSRSVVVSTKNCLAAFTHQMDAFIGICAVTNDVAEAHDFLDRLVLDQFQSPGEGLKVGMNVRNDGEAHSLRELVGLNNPSVSLPVNIDILRWQFNREATSDP